MLQCDNGGTALLTVFIQPNITKNVFDSQAFRLLFEREINIKYQNDFTLLMHICIRQPQILNNDLWFIPKLLE